MNLKKETILAEFGVWHLQITKISRNFALENRLALNSTRE
jgi:hypothetical protein